MTVNQLKTTITEEYLRQKRGNATGNTAYTASSSLSYPKKKKCTICKRTNHITDRCRWKGKNAPKCDICDMIGHNANKCYKNPQNKGKGCTKGGKDDKRKSSSYKGKGKGKAHANIAEQDSSSDGELKKSFTTYVNISDEGEISKADAANFSAYSWILDSGAMTHICAQLEVFATYQTIPQKLVKGLSDKPVAACGQGTVLLQTHTNSKKYMLCLHKVLYIPGVRQNLVSIGQIISAGGDVFFDRHKRSILCNTEGTEIAVTTLQNGLYHLDAHVIPPSIANVAIKVKRAWTWEEWHHKLGHIGI